MPWPSFLRRHWLLVRARAALARGEAEEALALLSDRMCAADPVALELAARARARIVACVPKPIASVELEVGVARASPLTRLLALRRELGSERARIASECPSERDLAPPPDVGRERAPRFRLAIDDAGEFLAAVGSDFVLGHLTSKTADLPFLASVEREHARIRLAIDFHGGPSWRLETIGASRARVNAREVRGIETALVDEDEVVLGDLLAFRVRIPRADSSSMVLELRRGAECLGAPRLLLVAPGAAGRVRISSKSSDHVRVPGLEQEISLVAREDGRLISLSAANDAPAAAPQVCGASFDLAVPPRASCRFTVGSRSKGRAPFSILIVPIDAPETSA